MNIQHQRLLRLALIGVYVAIPLVVSLGTYMGWLFQPGMPRSSGSDGVALGVMSLLGATMLAEFAGVFKRAASSRDVLKAVGYWLGGFLWIAAIVRVVPDNRIGGTLLIGPLSALMLGGMFHLARVLGKLIRSLSTGMMTATPVAIGAPISGSPPSPKLQALGSEPTQPGQIDIPANVGQIILRFLGGTAVLLVPTQMLPGTSYDGFWRYILYVVAIYLIVMAIRSFSSRGPALSLAPGGISIRRDVSPIRHLPWAQITGFEMKSYGMNTFLVIQIKDANELIAQCGPISRWTMGQSLAIFGSPVRIPTAWLKCDRNWLWQKLNEMLMVSRRDDSSLLTSATE